MTATRGETGTRTGTGDADVLGQVLTAAADVLSDLEPDAATRRILAAARELTGARHAAMSVLSPSGEVERFGSSATWTPGMAPSRPG